MSQLSRTDSYLGILAIVISNAMSFMNSTGPNNGYNLDAVPYDGLTEPRWIGVIIQCVSVIAWYVHFAALLLTVYQLYKGTMLGEKPDARTPTMLFVLAVFIAHAQMYMVDVAYWFNLFVSFQDFSIPESIGWVMYVVTEIPMTLFMIVYSVFAIRTYRLTSLTSTPPPAPTPSAPPRPVLDVKLRRPRI
jgi:hypothetical protein